MSCSDGLWFALRAVGRLFLAINDGAGLIGYAFPASDAMAATTTTLLALGDAAAVTHTPSSLFAATVFLAGALVGMGGMLASQSLHAPPRSERVLAPDLKKPLLVAKASTV